MEGDGFMTMKEHVISYLGRVQLEIMKERANCTDFNIESNMRRSDTLCGILHDIYDNE